MDTIKTLLLAAAGAFIAATCTVASAEQAMYTSAQHTANAAPGTYTDVFVQCPAGLVAYSGGFDSGFSDVIDVTSSAPTFDGATQTLLYNIADGQHTFPTGWHISARNNDEVPRPVTATVLCAPEFGTMRISVTSFTVAAGSAANPVADGVRLLCPAGKWPAGGGVDVQYPGTMVVSSSGPLLDGDFLWKKAEGEYGAPDGWSGYVRNEGPAGLVKVAAMCQGSGQVYTYVSALSSIEPGANGGIDLSCDGKALAGGGFDTENALHLGATFSTPFYSREPSFPSGRPDGIYPGPNGWTADVRNNGAAPLSMNVAIMCVGYGGILTSQIFTPVFEFYNFNLKHYFRTANRAEADAIDNGSAGPGWTRTGDDFAAYIAGGDSPGSDVCRFYTSGANSHFYTVEVPECIALQNPASGWQFESFAFRIGKPAAGVCAPGTIPIYRLYNDRFAFTDSNHRFTSSFGNIAAMEAQGWKAEGVAFCAPAD